MPKFNCFKAKIYAYHILDISVKHRTYHYRTFLTVLQRINNRLTLVIKTAMNQWLHTVAASISVAVILRRALFSCSYSDISSWLFFWVQTGALGLRITITVIYASAVLADGLLSEATTVNWILKSKIDKKKIRGSKIQWLYMWNNWIPSTRIKQLLWQMLQMKEVTEFHIWYQVTCTCSHHLSI